TPSRLSYLALVSEPGNAPAEREHLAALCAQYGKSGPAEKANHSMVDLGPFQLTWERHAEFSRYTVVAGGVPGELFSDPPIGLLPPEWVAGLKGRTLVSTHIALLPFLDNRNYSD